MVLEAFGGPGELSHDETLPILPLHPNTYPHFSSSNFDSLPKCPISGTSLSTVQCFLLSPEDDGLTLVRGLPSLFDQSHVGLGKAMRGAQSMGPGV